MERLTEWIEENGERRAQPQKRNGTLIPFLDICCRLVEYENIGTVEEFQHSSDLLSRLDAYITRLEDMIRRREDDLR